MRFIRSEGWRSCWQDVCRSRRRIYGNDQSQVLWPVGHEKLEFGTNYGEILQAFEAIETGDIAKSVEHLAWHEQRNILQPSMYTDQKKLTALLRSNHLSYVTGIPSGVAQAIELTLASQCRPVDGGQTIEFSNNPIANLADIEQRMAFVLRAADQFDQMLNDENRDSLAQSISEIAAMEGT